MKEMEGKILVRDAGRDDLNAILDIVNHNIREETSDYRWDEIDLDTLAEWFDDRKLQGFPIIVAELNDEVVGYATYCQFRERIGFQYSVEHSIYVQPGYTGKGIGGKLMDVLLKAAKDANMRCMVACINADNEGSIKFHVEKYSFTHCGILKEVGRKFDTWLDMVLLQKMLSDV
jgi:L-amino acid N-acyltransferase